MISLTKMLASAVAAGVVGITGFGAEAQLAQPYGQSKSGHTGGGGHTPTLPNPHPQTPSTPAPTYNNPTANSTSSAAAAAAAKAQADAKANANANATGGNANATGGSANSTATGGKGGNASATGGKGGKANATSGGSTSGSNNYIDNSYNAPVPIGNAPPAMALTSHKCHVGVGLSAGFPYGAIGISFTRLNERCAEMDEALSLINSGIVNGNNDALITAGLQKMRLIDPAMGTAIDLTVRAYMGCPALNKVKNGAIFAASPEMRCDVVQSMVAVVLPQTITRVVYRDAPAPVKKEPGCTTIVNNTFACPPSAAPENKAAPAPVTPPAAVPPAPGSTL